MNKKYIIFLTVIAFLGLVIFYIGTSLFAFKKSNDILDEFKKTDSDLNSKKTNTLNTDNYSPKTKVIISFIEAFKDSVLNRPETYNEFLFDNQNALNFNDSILSYKEKLKSIYLNKVAEINQSIDTITFDKMPLAAITNSLNKVKYDIIKLEKQLSK